MKKLFFVFDVESVGLHGESFAVGFVVVDATGAELDSGLLVCSHLAALEGIPGDREWVEANVPLLANTHTTKSWVRRGFWLKWMEWKEKGAMLFAECAWPVEARFLIDCIEMNRPERNWLGPYPLHDVASVLLAKGGYDTAVGHKRLENELPAHNPLCDARQSARLLVEALAR